MSARSRSGGTAGGRAAAASGEGGRLRFTLRALGHHNYRLFFGGQGISLIGTWITRVATSWLVYRLTGSAAILGIVSFAGQIPTFLLAPFAGTRRIATNARYGNGWSRSADGRVGRGATEELQRHLSHEATKTLREYRRSGERPKHDLAINTTDNGWRRQNKDHI